MIKLIRYKLYRYFNLNLCSWYNLDILWSFQTLLNESKMYLATILPAVLVLIITSVWAAQAAGASVDSLRRSFNRTHLTVPVSEN